MANLRLIWENPKAYHEAHSVTGFVSDEILQYLDREEPIANSAAEQVWCRKN
jgi:hypothetical protein